MSDNQSTVKNIIDIVLAKLNITERGKIENFFMKQRSELTKELRDLNKNKKTLIDEYQDAVEDVKESLEDAEKEVNEAYSDVTIEKISTNELAKSFAVTYWASIERAEGRLSFIKKSLDSMKEKYEEDLKEIEDQIAERERRLENIS